MNVATWIVFVLAVAFLPIDCWLFYRNACRGQLRLWNVVEIVAEVAVIASVATMRYVQ